MFDFRLKEWMELSLAALMQNLPRVQLRVHLGTLCLCPPVLTTWQRSYPFCSTRTSQECERSVWIFRAQQNPSEVSTLCAVCVKRQLEKLPGSLCWFSSRQDRQCAVDWRNASSQGRELCSCVVRGPPRQDTLIGWISLWLRPCSVIPCPLIPELGLELQL